MNTDLELTAGLKLSPESLAAVADAIVETIRKAGQKGAKGLAEDINAYFDKAVASKDRAERIVYSKAGIEAAQKFADKIQNAEQRAMLEMRSDAVRMAVLNPARQGARSDLDLERLKSLTEAHRLDPSNAQRVGTMARLVKRITAYREAQGLDTNIKSLTDARGQAAGWYISAGRATLQALSNTSLTPAQRKELYKQGMKYASTAEDLLGQPGDGNAGSGLRKDIRTLNDSIVKQTRTEEASTEQREKSDKIWSRFGFAMMGRAASATMEYARFALASQWGEAVTRNVMASRHAGVERYGMRAALAGSLVGSGVGGLLGGVVGSALGPWGTAIGLAVGQQIGDKIGKWTGELAGEREKNILARKEMSRDVALSARRDFYLYGGKEGHSFGNMLADAGLVSSASYNKMRWTGETLPGAMAFGMLGEQDMLMLSLMPEYYAALMNGESGAELAAAYQRSANNLPTMLRPLVATSVPGGSTDMYAASQDPLFGRAYWDNRAGLGGVSDQTLVGLSDAMQSAVINNAVRNLGQQLAYVVADATRMIRDKDLDFYDTTYVSPRAMDAYKGLTTVNTLNGEVYDVEKAFQVREAQAKLIHERATRPGDWEQFNSLVTNLSKWSDKTFNINVMLNGNRAAQTYLTIESVMTETETNIVGSMN